MKKERTMKIIILSVVFIVAVIGFSYWTNRGSAGVTADMGAATLPTISFESAGKTVNLLVGHKREMNVAAIRDTIAVYGQNGKLKVKLHSYENEIESLKYEICTLDGKEQLYEKTVENVKDTLSLKMGDVLKKGKEGVLKITLSYGGDTLYYYTRVIEDHDYHVKECLKYVEELHNNMINKENEDSVKKVMESNAQGDNTTLQHVTIHSNLNHVMWGNLKPKVINEISFEIKEAKKAYTSVQLHYQVECAGDNNKEEIYNVKEFFKVAYGTERLYLLEYDRTMEEVFNTSNVVLSSKGVVLGIAKENMPYKVNQEGTIVAFIQANELWSYSKKEDAFSLIFSFADSEKEDVRNRTDNHSIQILSMDEKGNMTFSVCGYMNRGEHEGESGIAIYYYNLSQNAVEEVAFVPSTQSQAVIEKELNDLAYYNKEQDVLYVMADGKLLKVKLGKDDRTVLMEGLQKGQYVASADGHMLAYQKQVDGKLMTEIWDFTNDSRRNIPMEAGEVVVPLGFVGADFVYGISLEENKGYDAAGMAVQAMHRLEIRNTKHEVVKTYEKKDVYILGAIVEGNMITLRQGTKNGNAYLEIEEDYITNNESVGNEFVSLKSYWTDLKETQYRLVFSDGIQDKKAKTLKPKLVLQERPTVLEFESGKETEYFYVYGLGEQAGAFEEAGEAIELASKLSGVVLSPKQNYIWEEDNRVAWYRNFEIDRFAPNVGESTLAACVRKVLSYEGKKVDVASEMTTKSPEEIISEKLRAEAVHFRGCSAKDMFYLIDKGTPVIALKDGSNAILLIGYDAKTVTYVEPSSGSIFTSAIDKVDGMLAGSAHTFIGYAK